MRMCAVRILIAEDDLTSRKILSGVLRKIGHEVLETVDGFAAWTELQKPDGPKLAILDWMMPEMEGLDVVRKVRALDIEKPPYIIMLTTRGEKSDIIAGLDAGANDYLSKPFDTGELQARVEVGRRMIELQDALVESRKALAYEASHDPLTKLANRRAVLEYLELQMVSARENGDILTAGMCDIDHFKKVNDTWGHQVGDDVLCELAHLLRESVEGRGAAGRMGGEEFLLVLRMKPGGDFMGEYAAICARIAATPLKTRAGDIPVTVSIGVSCASGKSSVDAILGPADAALYSAKAGGRNRAVFASLENEENAETSDCPRSE